MVRTANFISCQNVASRPQRGAGHQFLCWKANMLEYVGITLCYIPYFALPRELGKYYSICPTFISLIATIFITLLVQLLLSGCQVDHLFY